MANTKIVKVDPKDVDVIIGLDKSGSMSWGSEPGQKGIARWTKGEEVLTVIAEEMEQYDDDGLTVFVFDNGYKIEDGVNAAKVAEIFKKYRPDNGTTLAPPLKDLIAKYLPAKTKGWFGGSYEKVVPAKPVCFLVFTDGCPSDKNDVAAAIIDATKRTDQGNVGFLFIQVGHDDEAQKFLEWLDTNLKGAAYDCVSRTRLEAVEKLTAVDLINMAFNGTDNS